MKPPVVKRHLCNIVRPSTTRDSRGQTTGSSTVVAVDVPFGLRPLQGRERELARKEYASATVAVTMHLDPRWALTPKDSFVRVGGSKSGQALNIGYIKDNETDGVETEIICGEGDL